MSKKVTSMNINFLNQNDDDSVQFMIEEEFGADITQR